MPLPPAGPRAFGGGFVYDGFFDLPGSLPRVFAEHGYRTAFLSTGDLGFGGKGGWLDALGFHETRGHDDPFCRGWPRLHFRAAPDSALYWADPRHPEPRRVEARFQQVDLPTSFEAMLTGRSCPGTVRGDLLADQPAPPRCVLHVRSDDRGKVDVACGDDRATIRRQGDASHVESGSVPGGEGLVDQIALERMERRTAGARH